MRKKGSRNHRVKFKKIIPVVKICKRCRKERVKNHHFLCDKCWGETAKRKYNEEQRKMLESAIRRIKERNERKYGKV